MQNRTKVIAVAIAAITVVGAGPALGRAAGASTQANVDEFSFITIDSASEGERFELFEKRLETCMSARGFEYEPIAAPEDPRTVNGIALINGETLPEKEFTEMYGLGVVENTLIELRGEPLPPSGNPNESYVAALDDSTRQEYFAALDGNEKIEGCFEIVASGFDQPSADQAPNYDVLYAQAVATKDVGGFLVGWQLCMAESGYAFDSPDDLERAIDEELNVILDETVEAFSIGELSAPDAESSQFARLAELQEREIVAAMASLDCGVAEGRQLLKEAIAELAERGG